MTIRHSLFCAVLLQGVLSVVHDRACTAGSWVELERPTVHDLLRLKFLDGMNGWVAGKQGTIMRTSDGGMHWEQQESNSTADIVDVFMLDAEKGWALESVRYEDTSTWYGTSVLRTTNGGSTWTHDPPLGIGKYYNRVAFADSSRGWLCGAYGDLLVTTDGGTEWFPASVDSGFRIFWPMLNIRFYSANYGFVMGGTWDLIGLLWKTTDGGQEWSVHDVSPEPVYDLHFQDSLRIVGMVGDLDYGVSTIRTTDGGENWSYRFLGMLGLPTALSFRTPTEGWAPLGFPGELLYTPDGGETWNRVPTPRGTPVYDLVFTDSTTGFAVGDSGLILKYSSTTLAVTPREGAEAGPEAILGAPYPDPWNASTRFAYELPREGWVRLMLYNVLGEEVQRLVDGPAEAGSHSVIVNGDRLPSGTYFIVLEAGTTIAVRKTLLVR